MEKFIYHIYKNDIKGDNRNEQQENKVTKMVRRKA